MSDENEATEPTEPETPTAETPAVETPAAEPETLEPAAEEAPAAEPPIAEPAEPEAPAAESAEPAAEETPAAAEPAAEDAPAEEAPAEAPAAEEPAPAEAAAEPAPTAEAPAAEPAAAPSAAPVVGESLPAGTPAPAAVPAAPLPKPGEEGYDPDQGLGLVDSTPALGPPNLGGFESGEIVTGMVLTVTKREAEVDLGNGKVGVISDRHWSSGQQIDLTTVVATGDSVDAAVLARADVKKRITLSHLWAQQKRGWEAAEGAAKDKSDLTGTITETVKGGLSLDVNGIRAFMPASLVDVTTVNDLKPFVGQTVQVRVIEADRTKQRLIVSRKAAMRATQRQQAKAALGDIKVGQKMTGVVAQITDFGAFVDVEGVRGLVHKSEIGWSRARDPQRDLKVGQEVEVTVVKVQPSRNRLGLSMKSGNDPLREVNRGDRFEGTVSRLADFGAFVQLPSGLEGLVHVSEMAEYRVFAPEEIVMPGEKVWVKVLKIDKKRRTVDLSMAQAVVPDPPAEVEAREAEAAAREAAAAKAGEAPAEDAAAEAPADDAAAEAPAANDNAAAVANDDSAAVADDDSAAVADDDSAAVADDDSAAVADDDSAAVADDDYAEDGGAGADASAEEE